jgi:hypothetical protein
MLDDLKLPAQIMAELQAAHAKRMSHFWDAPNGRQYQLWLAPGGLVMIELHPNGSAFLWQPLAHQPAGMPTFLGELRAYLSHAGSDQPSDSALS